jgi:hypothetical protein
MTAWGIRRELVELCGGRHDGHRYRAEEVPETVEMPELPAVGDGVPIGDTGWRYKWVAKLVYRQTHVVREADGAHLYVLEGMPWRGFEVDATP